MKTRLVTQIGLGLVAAVLMLLVQMLLLNRQSDDLAEAEKRTTEVTEKIQASLDSDETTKGLLSAQKESFEAVAKSQLVVGWWSSRSLEETGELYLARHWKLSTSVPADLTAYSRATRRVTQGQELLRASLSSLRSGMTRAALDLFYGWPQWAASTLLMVILAAALFRRRLHSIELSERWHARLAGLIIVLGGVGFLTGIASALSESSSEEGLRSGLARSLYPVITALICRYLADWSAPNPANSNTAIAANANAAPNPIVSPSTVGPTSVAELRGAVKLGVLDAALVLVDGLEKQ